MIMQKTIETSPMTPARFDLMKAVTETAGATQRVLAEKLGVVRGAVTQMVARLRQLGWLETRPSSKNVRHQIISLTEQGRSLLDAARRLTKGRQFAGTAFGIWLAQQADSAKFRPYTSTAARKTAVHEFLKSLTSVAKLFGDTSTLYPAAHSAGEVRSVHSRTNGEALVKT